MKSGRISPSRALVLSTKLLVLPILVAFSCSDEPTPHHGYLAKVTHLEGKVKVKRNGADEALSATLGIELFSGDEIWVGDSAKAEISVVTGELLPLHSNTSLLLNRATGEEAQPALFTRTMRKLLSIFFRVSRREETLAAEGSARSKEEKVVSSLLPIRREKKAIITTEGGTWRTGYSGTDPYTVALYHFDEESGSVARNAQGDSSLNGELVGFEDLSGWDVVSGSGWTANGRLGGALMFDGSGDGVEIGDAPPLRITDALTLEAWVKLLPDAGSDQTRDRIADHIISKFDPQFTQRHGYGMQIIRREGNFGLILGLGTYAAGLKSFPLSSEPGEWHHLAATYDGRRIRLWVDGVLNRTSAESRLIVPGPQRLCIGKELSRFMKDTYFHGVIDEVRISNVAREFSPSQFPLELVLSLGGEGEDVRYAYSIASAGDLNGDGFDDFAIASPWDGEGEFAAGKVEVYLGGPDMTNTPDFVLRGEKYFERLGASVSLAGDVNGDGYDDLIVSALTFEQEPERSASRVCVYFGSACFDTKPDVVLYGVKPFDSFGGAVSSAGDVNGDGIDDLVIGASGSVQYGQEWGSAYIFFGGRFFDDNSDLILKGEVAGDEFGCSVAEAGDINGDGFSDVLIGARQQTARGDNSGKAYLFLGGKEMDSEADLVMSGEAAGDEFGFAVSLAGDVNDDGYDDFIVGAPLNDAGGFDAGRAYLFLGGETVDNIPDFIVAGKEELAEMGRSGASLGDVNADGFDDFIVGASPDPSCLSPGGNAYVFLGGRLISSDPAAIIPSHRKGTSLGFSVGSGDVNNDGYPEVIVGAPASLGSGMALVFSPVLSNFRATAGGPVVVEWHLSTETDYQSYNLYKSTSEHGPYSELNSELIMGLGRHVYKDEAVIPGITYYYKLGALHRKGHEIFYGPISATIETDMP